MLMLLDELIIAKEHFAEIGDDLDFTFVDLIDGIDPIWSYRRPKPPTPPPREPSPPKTVITENKREDGGASGESVPGSESFTAEGAALAEQIIPKEPSPFELNKDFPADGAEVPFVKSFENTEVVVKETPVEAPKPDEETPVAQEAQEAPAEVAPAQEAEAISTETPNDEAKPEQETAPQDA